MAPLVGLGLGACGGEFDFSRFTRPHRFEPPAPSSPAGAVRLLEWSYNRKAIGGYRELFTGDFRFSFSPLDSAGAPYRETPWNRDDELISATRLFEGGHPTQPPASIIRLALDKNLVVDPIITLEDPDGSRHMHVRTQLLLIIQMPDGATLEVSGSARLYLVRGDAAVIPDELVQRGFQPDPSRWYISGWSDETTLEGVFVRARPRSPALTEHGPRPSRVAPTTKRTWGWIKHLYRT